MSAELEELKATKTELSERLVNISFCFVRIMQTFWLPVSSKNATNSSQG